MILEEDADGDFTIYDSTDFGSKDPFAGAKGVIERNGNELKLYDTDDFGNRSLIEAPKAIIELDE